MPFGMYCKASNQYPPVLIPSCSSALNVEAEKLSYDPTIEGWQAYMEANPQTFEDLRSCVSGKLMDMAGKDCKALGGCFELA